MIGTRIPVEPLPERSRARLERAVLDAVARDPLPVEPARAPGRAGGGWRFLALGGLAATAAAAVALVVWSGDPTVRVAPTRVVTEATPSLVSVGEATLEVGAESALVASGDDAHGVVVVLERGRVTCSVPPRRGRAPFVVQAGGVRVEVVGTRFTVTRDGETATVTVEEGTVRVIAGGEQTLVPAGQRWPAAPEAAASGSAVPEAEPELQLDEDVASVTPRRKPAPREAAPAADAQATFEQAARLERSDPERAVALYLEIVQQGGPWAPPALFAAGRLSFDRLDAGIGRGLLEEYVRRYPDGKNAADARRLLGQR